MPANNASTTSTLRVNHLALAYQPRRVVAAGVSIAWNLALAGGFVLSDLALRLYEFIASFTDEPVLLVPLFTASCFAGYSIGNLPLDLWTGYLDERHFALVKDGLRAWLRDWLIGSIQHGVMFVLGGCAIVGMQMWLGSYWLMALAGLMLVLFLTTTFLGPSLLPSGLFHLEPLRERERARLEGLIGRRAARALPPIVVFSASGQRDYAGGLMGLGFRQVLMISRSTLNFASDRVLRFVLLHELGHQRGRHLLSGTILGWLWMIDGIALSDWLIGSEWHGSAMYVAWLMLTLSIWMALGEPILAYLGRRMEYQADIHYLKHGGTLEEMEAALDELAQRNLARTDVRPRGRTMLHPLPSVTTRLARAKRYLLWYGDP